jgi:hypothetical protein
MDSNSLGGSAEPAKLRVFIAQSRVMVSRQMGAWYHNLRRLCDELTSSVFPPAHFFVDLVQLHLDVVGDLAQAEHVFSACSRACLLASSMMI